MDLPDRTELLAQFRAAFAEECREAGGTFEQRQRQLFRAWAVDQLDELKQTYLDKLVQPITPDGVPLERIMARVTGDAKHDLESYLDAIRLCFDQRMLPATPLLMFKSIEVSDLSRYQAMFPGMKCLHIPIPFTARSSARTWS